MKALALATIVAVTFGVLASEAQSEDYWACRSYCNGVLDSCNRYSPGPDCTWKWQQCLAGCPAEPNLSLQVALKRAGFDPGNIDGKIGKDTLSALKSYQMSQGMPQSGKIDAETAATLFSLPKHTPPSGSAAVSKAAATTLTNHCTCNGATQLSHQISCGSGPTTHKATVVCWTKKILATGQDCGTVCDSDYTACNGTASHTCN